MYQRIFLLFVFSALALTPLANAQQALTGSIRGSVTDATGSGVPGAKIAARNLNTGLERSIESGSLGTYNLTALPVGEYEVKTEAKGFAERKVSPVKVGVGQSITLDLALSVSAQAEQVTVDASVAAIETTRSAVTSRVDGNQIKNLGLNGRDFLSFLLLSPGVTRDVRGGDLSFAGQRGTLNNIQVDGADNNNNFYGQSLGRTGTNRAPYQFSVDSVEEFQVNSSGFSAELGRAGGAVVNVVTRSGTNDFHGSAFEYFRDRYLNANTWINNSVGRPRQPFHVNQFGGTLGGPVIVPGLFNGKNKDFFFFNYDGQRRTLPNAVFLGTPIPAADLANPANAAGITKLNSLLTPYTLGFNQDVLLLKNDLQINDKHRLSVRYNYQRFVGKGLESNGNQVAFEHSGDAKVMTDTFAASFTSILSPKLLNEFRFNYLRDDEPGVAYTENAETILRQNGITALTFGSSAITPRFANIKGVQFADNLTRTSGRHTYKAGFDINHNSISNYFAGNARGSFVFNSYADFFASRPASYVQAFPSTGTDGFTTRPDFTEIGLYIQDEFRATPKLTLNYGLRYDLALLTKPPVKNPDAGLAAFGLDTSVLNTDKKDFGPRFGFAYKPLNTNKFVIRGGYGFFWGRIPQILTSTAYNQNGISAASVTFTGAAIPAYPNNYPSRPTGLGAAAVPSILLFDKNFQSPLVLQGSLGIEFEPIKNTTISLTYLNVRGQHLARTRDVNLFPAAPVSVNLSGIGSQTLYRYPGPQGAPSRPLTNFARIELFESAADSYYNGFTLAMNRRFSHNYTVNLSYTFSKVIDTVPDFTSVVPFNGGDDAKMALYPTNPGLDRAPGVNDQRHRVVTNFVWDLNYFATAPKLAQYLIGGWQLSGTILAQTGQPYSLAVGGDANNDSNSANERVPQFGRNTQYGPTIANWDLRVSKAFTLFERIKFTMALDAFNALNNANFLASNIRNGRYNATFVGTAANPAVNFTPTTNFGTYSGQTLDNRILQISGKITF